MQAFALVGWRRSGGGDVLRLAREGRVVRQAENGGDVAGDVAGQHGQRMVAAWTTCAGMAWRPPDCACAGTLTCSCCTSRALSN